MPSPKNNAGHGDALRHTITYLGVRAANGVIALASLAVLSRLLSAEQYGRYALGIAIIGAASTILFQWLNTAASRFHAAHAAAPQVLVAGVARQWLIVAAGAGVPTLLLAGGLVVLGRQEQGLFVLVLGVGVLSMGWFNLQLQLANARGEPGRYGKLTTARAVGALSLTAVLLLAGGGTGAALGAYAAAALLVCLALGTPVLRALRTATRDPGLQGQFLRYGAPLAMTYVCTMATDYTDRFIIAAWHGPAAVAGYAAGYDLAQQTAGAALNAFYLAAFPMLAATWERAGADAARSGLGKLAGRLLLAAALIASLFIVLAQQIAAVLFGAEMRGDAGLIVPWVAAAVAVAGFKSFVLDIPFQLLKRTSTQLAVNIVMMASNVTLNLLLVPSQGARGAAMASLVSFSLAACLSYWLGRRSGLMPALGAEVLKALLCAGAAVLAALAIGDRGPSLTAGLTSLAACLPAFLATAWIVDLAGLRSRTHTRPDGPVEG